MAKWGLSLSPGDSHTPAKTTTSPCKGRRTVAPGEVVSPQAKGRSPGSRFDTSSKAPEGSDGIRPNAVNRYHTCAP
jgi:hypothetical protein